MPYRQIEDPTKLRRVLEAMLHIEGDLELPALLRHVIEEACSISGARYGALGVLDTERTGLSEFITVGLDAEMEHQIGPRPTGKGVLGVLISEPIPLRLSNISAHDKSYGFPPVHPPMTSFIGVPIKVRGEVYGNLYLTEKIGWSEFTTDDVALVEVLALAAGIAIESVRLHQRVQEAALYEDRSRLARDLHDTVIQRLFGIGLTLQSIASQESNAMSKSVMEVIPEIDTVIQQVRSTIYELGMTTEARGVRDWVIALLRELSTTLGFDVTVSFAGPIDAGISDAIAEHLLATVREAATNIARHSGATAAWMSIAVENRLCTLTVVDNGSGMNEAATSAQSLGLGNLKSRAEQLHGSFSIESPESGGTILIWQVPVGS